jgi:hypothetical protein
MTQKQILYIEHQKTTAEGRESNSLTTADVTKELPICHSKIQTFNWIVNQLLVREISYKKWHSSNNLICHTDAETKMEKEEREVEDISQGSSRHQPGRSIRNAHWKSL